MGKKALKKSTVNGNPLQYSCLENSMGGGAWYVTYSLWDPKRVRHDWVTSLCTLYFDILINEYMTSWWLAGYLKAMHLGHECKSLIFF